MNTIHQPIQAKRLMSIVLVAALCSATPGFAQQAASQADRVHEAEAIAAKRAEATVRAAESRKAAQEANVRRSQRFAESLMAAETEQRAALEAVEAARAELLRQAEMAQERSQRASEEQRDRAEEQRIEALELREIQRELERAHANLRRASQEVAHVHRDLYRVDHVLAPMVRSGGNQAFIGVVLGENTPRGVRIVAVSPGGPAERAGMKPGDLIVSLMGEPLSEGGMDARNVLTEAMSAIEPGDELIIGYERDDALVEKTLTAEERTPFSWQTVTRLASPPLPPAAPGAPQAPPKPTVSVQTIDGPTIRVTELTRDLSRLREELGDQGLFIEDIQSEVIEDFESEDGIRTIIHSRSSGSDPLSEPGLAAVAATGIWFGVPLTRGLKLTELDAELGAYFDVNEGVLVVSATPDNELLLRSGDVILSIAGRDVQRPGDVMRALRTVNAGDMITLHIKRQGEEQTFDLEIPQNSISLHFSDELHENQVDTLDFQIDVPRVDDH